MQNKSFNYYFAIVFLFILMFTNNWFSYWAMAFVFSLWISWVARNNKSINQRYRLPHEAKYNTKTYFGN